MLVRVRVGLGLCRGWKAGVGLRTQTKAEPRCKSVEGTGKIVQEGLDAAAAAAAAVRAVHVLFCRGPWPPVPTTDSLTPVHFKTTDYVTIPRAPPAPGGAARGSSWRVWCS